MDPNAPIAIIGMSCRFGGSVDDPEKLWRLCAEGRSVWSEIPTSRFNLDGVYHPNYEKLNTTNVIGGHFLDEDVALFDAAFFNLSAESAATLDPQFRMQLETTFEAFESAGLTLEDVAGSNTSVFAGAFFRDYHDSHMRDPEALPRFLLLGTGSAMASNRLSHFFDLRGPSMSIDTGCSTTLTAVHQACLSLRAGECGMSIVGGANVMLNPDMFVAMSSLTLVSKDGKSYAFDDRANGYGRGEGSATLILKRLDDAIRDGDPIRAVIRESGVNQDGKTETITTPSEEAQQTLIKACYSRAGLDPAETMYFEAHGTGTRTGDPIEARAIASVFQDTKSSDQPLRLGSVKANIGHTETASGVAAIIKVALALEKGQIPPSANFEKPNEKLKLDEWKLRVPTELEPWPDTIGVRRASINNFGYGGSNAHVILQDYQSIKPSSAAMNGSGRRLNGFANGASHSLTNGSSHTNGDESRVLKQKIILLSGKDEQAAQVMAANLKEYILNANIEDETVFLNDLAYTLGQRRTRFPWSTSVYANNVASLVEKLGSEKTKPFRGASSAPRLGFVFTGQGAQWWAMGRELIDAYPVFKASLMDADRNLKELGVTWNLIEELQRDAESTRVNELEFSTAVCVALQIALFHLLASWGIKPVAVTSHSSGEMAAAYAAGALSMRNTMAIVSARGQLAADAIRYVKAKGGMMAVGLGVEAAQKYLSRVSSGKIVVACENSPASITISGDAVGLDELEAILKQEKVFARRLKVEAAWHSHHMQPIADSYHTWMSKRLVSEQGRTNVIYSSPSTGKRMDDVAEIGGPRHWVRSLTHPVQFVNAFRNMCFEDSESEEPSVDMVIEVGPHGALSGPISDIMGLPQFKGNSLPYGTCLVRKSSALDTIHALVCDLVRRGYPVDLGAVNFPHVAYGLKVLPDLPRYPWNHQVRHWSEPRVNKAHRARIGSPHDLLGTLVFGCCLDAPVWRHIIRTKEMPWVRDHVVQSNIVYPGAGFIAMAIEGASFQACQLASGENRVPLGYRLRDVEIQQALIIPESSDGVEVQLSLRPCSDKAIYTKGWKEFHVQSATLDNKWIEHCKGLIMVEFAPANSDENIKWVAKKSQASKLTQPARKSDYRITINPQDIYSGMRSVGIYHGPVFQNLKEIHARSEQSVVTFNVADAAAVMPNQFQHKHVMHPTTLDSVFQAAYSALPGAATTIGTPKVPRTIRKLWVSHEISATAGHHLRAYSRIDHADDQSFTGEITVVNATDDEATLKSPVITMNGFVCQSIGTALAETGEAYEKDKFSVGKWAPDITFMKPTILKKMLTCNIEEDEIEAIIDLRRLCLQYVFDALATLTIADIQQLQWHHKKFFIWMKLQVEQAWQNKLGPNSSEWINASEESKAALIAKAKARSVNGELVCRLGPHIVSILRGELTPLELMLEEKLLYRYYVDCLKWSRSNAQMGELVRYFVHKNPRAKIIEIGGGTGGTTTHVLNAIGKDDSGNGPQAASYDFTDISSGFFEAAAEKFADWKSLMRYKKLDIEQSPASQGFEEGTYDLVIACQVLHATKSMDNTMANVRSLLKPGGKLFLFETTQDQVDLQFAFGLLPGWWLSEEKERKFSPSLSIDMWNRVLYRNGFKGVEAEVHDCDSEEFYSFSIISSTVETVAPASSFDIVFLTGNPAPPKPWLDQLRVSIGVATGSVPVVQDIESVDIDDTKVCLFIDAEETILSNPTPAQFAGIKTICTKAKGLLWLTRGGALECEQPQSSLCVGFLRSLREEYIGKRMGMLDLDPDRSLWSEETITTVTDLFEKMFDYSITSSQNDYEFAHRDGIIHTLRYFKDVDRNKAIFYQSGPQTPSLEPFDQPNRPLRLSIGTSGLLDTLAFDDDTSVAEALPQDFIEVEPKAFGVNFRDVMVAMGQLKHRVMGFECAGIVRKVGADAASHGYKAGDRVTMLLRGHYGSRARVHWTSAVHMPEDMSFEAAASLPTVYATAYVSLYDSAKLQKGESILIHSASGGVGQAAIMLAQHVGAEIFVTVGTEEKRNFVIENYGIPADHIFSSRDTSFAAGILAMTNNRGVDVVLNSLAGVLLQESFNCLAPFGRFIELGKRDLEQNHSLELDTFTRAVSFSSIDLIAFGEHKGMAANRILKEVMRLLADGKIRPVQPITNFSISEAEKAFRLMQAGKHMGKLVLSVEPNVTVPVFPRKTSTKLNPDASYMVVGGFGGIGRSVCHWMAEHGASNLVIVSRSNKYEDKVEQLQTEMAHIGRNVKVHVMACDISDAAALSVALQKCNSAMPPIRGIVHGGMVLQDSVLEHMTIDNYYAAIGPKLMGSWNLHQHFTGQDDLDFYIMLSSQAGVVGFASQCNYSAGGSFQDALASHRIGRGLPCATIDLGMVKSVGYLAGSDGKTIKLLQKQGHLMLSEEDVLAGMESAIATPFCGQLILGLNTGPSEHLQESPLVRDLRFSALKYRETSDDPARRAAKAGDGSDLGAGIAAAAGFDEAVQIVTAAVGKKLMDIFMIAEDEVVSSKAPTDFGVDSLVAVELRNMLALRAGAEVSIFDIMQSPSLVTLAATVVAKSRYLDPAFVPS